MRHHIAREHFAECIWNLMAHGDAWEGKWRGNWQVEWVASTLTLPRNMVYSALLTLMCTPRLPVVDRTDVPADLNGLVRFVERRNLVSVRVPSHFKRSLTSSYQIGGCNIKTLWSCIHQTPDTNSSAILNEVTLPKNVRIVNQLSHGHLLLHPVTSNELSYHSMYSLSHWQHYAMTHKVTTASAYENF